MKIMYNGKQVHEIVTNHSMTIEEGLSLFVDINSQEDLAANENELPYIYQNDAGIYEIDIENLETCR